MTETQNLTELLRSLARASGFDHVGFASAKPVERPDRFINWIQQGNHCGMNWLCRRINERLNPALLMPGALSVAVFAINYYQPSEEPENPECALISRYAWGKDYHAIIGEKLKQIAARLNENIPGIKCGCYVDTSPVMEKYWAVQSGVGWQGKHTIIISPESGSWIFLGVMLIDKPLIYDTPIESRCGDCDLCLKACPTGALSEPGVLDARKCISYWTIENKNQKIPANVSGKMNPYIYGCDICQNVCPWNHMLRKTSAEKSFFPVRMSFTREELHHMSESEFESIFSGSTIARNGLRRLRQNALAMYGTL